MVYTHVKSFTKVKNNASVGKSRVTAGRHKTVRDNTEVASDH